MTSKLGQTHLKSDRKILFTQHNKTHTQKKNLGQNSFPQKTANIWKLGTVVRETKSVSVLKGNQLGAWGDGADIEGYEITTGKSNLLKKGEKAPSAFQFLLI